MISHAKPTPQRVVEAACAVVGVDVSEVLSGRRFRRHAEARWIASLLLRERLWCTYPEIAAAFSVASHAGFHRLLNPKQIDSCLKQARTRRVEIDLDAAWDLACNGGEFSLLPIRRHEPPPPKPVVLPDPHVIVQRNGGLDTPPAASVSVAIDGNGTHVAMRISDDLTPARQHEALRAMRDRIDAELGVLQHAGSV